MFLALAVFLIFFKLPYDTGFGPSDFILCLAGIFIAGILFYLMMSLVEMAAFWAENVWSLLVMLRFTVMFLGGVMVPISLFPDWLIQILKFTPFPYLVSFQVRTLIGQMSYELWFEGIAVLTIWIFIFAALNRVVLGLGLKRYTGVGI
jgi:ABC-2 type transport system permease protein